MAQLGQHIIVGCKDPKWYRVRLLSGRQLVQFQPFNKNAKSVPVVCEKHLTLKPQGN